MNYVWQTFHKDVDGHRLFIKQLTPAAASRAIDPNNVCEDTRLCAADGRVRVWVADNSGRTPDTTEGGTLEIDPIDEIELCATGGGYISGRVPVTKEQDPNVDGFAVFLSAGCVLALAKLWDIPVFVGDPCLPKPIPLDLAPPDTSGMPEYSNVRNEQEAVVKAAMGAIFWADNTGNSNMPWAQELRSALGAWMGARRTVVEAPGCNCLSCQRQRGQEEHWNRLEAGPGETIYNFARKLVAAAPAYSVFNGTSLRVERATISPMEVVRAYWAAREAVREDPPLPKKTCHKCRHQVPYDWNLVADGPTGQPPGCPNCGAGSEYIYV